MMQWRYINSEIQGGKTTVWEQSLHKILTIWLTFIDLCYKSEEVEEETKMQASKTNELELQEKGGNT